MVLFKLKLTLKFGSYEEILVIKNVKTSFKGHELRESIRNVFNIDDFHLCTSNGVDIKLNKQILNGDKFCVYPKVLGGKVSVKILFFLSKLCDCLFCNLFLRVVLARYCVHLVNKLQNQQIEMLVEI